MHICATLLIAGIILITILVIMTTVRTLSGGGCEGYRAKKKGRDGYLIYPYIDLDEIGERGSYYALSECPGG